jgi:preprotein translocase SecF subunit
MSRSRALLILVIAALSAVMAWTAPYLVRHTKIGLEFRGGYELTFTADPLEAGGVVSPELLTKTAEILSERANATGVSEPQVNVLGQNQIRLILAGVSQGDPVLAKLRDPTDLPVKLTQTYSETVGGVLGASDLAATLGAAGIAAAILLGFLILVYRIPGLIAGYGLAVFVWVLLVAFNLLGAILSLSAIVAYVLGIGIAAGASIIQYERIRDELKTASGLQQALQQAATKSLRTVLDANATVFICAAILLAVGIGPIRGFALTTMLGVAFSLLVNVFFARWLLRLAYSGREDLGTIFGSWRILPQWQGEKALLRFDFIRWGRLIAVAALIFITVGLIVTVRGPLNYDIEFKSGTALDIQIDKPITQADATDLMFSAGVAPATVAIGGANNNMIAARFDDVLTTADVDSIIGRYKDAYGENVTFAENTADPAVARHLAVQSTEVILLALAGTFLFILFRFGWRYAVASLATVFTSVLFVMACFALFYQEIDITFIAALLTVIGYSLNEAVVVFDRIRENFAEATARARDSRRILVNRSIAQVLRRSIFTAFTVITGSVCLYEYGAEPLQMFSLAIGLGLACGSVASLFIAPNLLLLLQPTQSQPASPGRAREAAALGEGRSS